MGILIFLSYSTKDSERYRIKEIAEKLIKYPEIDNVLYWEEDMKDDIIKYMNENLNKCNILVLVCSKNSLSSVPVESEWQTAFKLGKLIIPLFKKEEDIPPLLTTKLGIKYNARYFLKTIEKLHELILKKAGIRKQNQQNYLSYVKNQLESKKRKESTTALVVQDLRGKDIRARIIVQIIKIILVEYFNRNRRAIAKNELDSLNKLIQTLNNVYNFSLDKISIQELKSQQFEFLINFLFGFGTDELKNKIKSFLYKFMPPTLSKNVLAGDIAFLIISNQEFIENLFKTERDFRVKLEIKNKLKQILQPFKIQEFNQGEFNESFDILVSKGFIIYEQFQFDEEEEFIEFYEEEGEGKWSLIASELVNRFIQNNSLIYLLTKYCLINLEF